MDKQSINIRDFIVKYYINDFDLNSLKNGGESVVVKGVLPEYFSEDITVKARCMSITGNKINGKYIFIALYYKDRYTGYIASELNNYNIFNNYYFYKEKWFSKFYKTVESSLFLI